MTSHGTEGPIQISYPNFLYDQSGTWKPRPCAPKPTPPLFTPFRSRIWNPNPLPANFLDGLSQLGLALLDDPNTGASAGASLAPSSITAQNQSRADSRSAYLDPVLRLRRNLHLASEQVVTRIWMSTNGTTPAVVVPPFGQLRRAHGLEVSSWEAETNQ
jgi:choline dehydrogenase